MALLSLDKKERMMEYHCIDLLPNLEEDVFFDDLIITDLEDNFTSGLDDWWDGFVSDIYL